MKIVIRYLGIHLVETTLEGNAPAQKEYLIGRNSECHFKLTQSFISRKQGKIFFKNDQWWYQDLRQAAREPRQIQHDAVIVIERDVELVTEEFLKGEKTGFHEHMDFKTLFQESQSLRKKIALTVKFGGAAAAVIALFITFLQTRSPLPPDELLEWVKPKIVEFEQNRDVEAIDQIKRYANLTDKDFRESSGFCSGFIIAPDVVLTANHCIRGTSDFDVRSNFQLKTYDGKRHEITAVLGFDTQRDYLFLQVNGLKEYGHLKFDTDYSIGQKVYTIGNVAGQGVAIRDGITASKTQDADDPTIEYLRYSAAASPGNSGGPLVDGWGKVVGLVFARSYSENYNLATGSEHLVEGRKKFVDDQTAKVIQLKSKEMFNYNGFTLLSLLGLPSHFAWREHPELTQSLNEISIDVKVPEKLEPLAENLLRETNKIFKDRYQSITKEMQKRDLADGQWINQINKDTPLIIPSRMEFNDLRLVKAGKSAVAPAGLLSLKPTSFNSYKEFKTTLNKEKIYKYYSSARSLYDLNPELQKSDGLKSYSSIPKERKTNLGFLFYEPILHAELDFRDKADLQAARFPASKDLKKALLGEEGLLIEFIVNPFLRPKSFNPFTLKDLNESPTHIEVKDGLGRIWKRSSWTLFGWVTFDQYCMPLPQGSYCATVTLQNENKELLNISRENFLSFELSEMQMDPIFWSVTALREFQQSPYAVNVTGLNDLEFKDGKNNWNILLKRSGLSFKFSKEKGPSMLRLSPGLYFSEGQSEWITLGLQGYFQQNKKRRVCSIEVELEGMHSSFVMSQHQESRKIASSLNESKNKSNSASPFSGYSKNSRSQFSSQFFRSPSLSSNGKVIGQCGDLESSDFRPGEYYIGYGNVRPYDVDFKVR